MTKIFDVYKCNICGNIIEVNHKGNGTLTCCNTQMELLKPNTKEGNGAEKHIPVVARKSTGYLIKVGSIAHPMTKDHLIEWIEIITDENKIYKKYFTAGTDAQLLFQTNGDSFEVRCYCNLHGLWSAAFNAKDIAGLDNLDNGKI